MANIVITGANQGIGYFFVKQLLKTENKVAVFDLSTDHLKKLKLKYVDRLLYFTVDVRDQEALHCALASVVSEFSIIDVAIHNACKCTFEAEADTDLDTYRDVLDVNYFGALRLVKSVLPYMVKQNSLLKKNANTSPSSNTTHTLLFLAILIFTGNPN